MHAVCVCKRCTILTSVFRNNSEVFLRLQLIDIFVLELRANATKTGAQFCCSEPLRPTTFRRKAEAPPWPNFQKNRPRPVRLNDRKTPYATQAGDELVRRYGFKRLPIRDQFAAPVGSILVFGHGAQGHVSIRTKTGFVSDYWTSNRCIYPLVAVYAKFSS